MVIVESGLNSEQVSFINETHWCICIENCSSVLKKSGLNSEGGLAFGWSIYGNLTEILLLLWK